MAKKTSKQSQLAAAAHKSESDSILSIDPVDEPRYGNGTVRQYLITNPSAALVKNRRIHSKEYYMIATLLISALYVRCTKLSFPDSVVFDEVHFGGFARKYILGQFFMDVHPPLAKMLFAAVGTIGGFKGDFEFKNIGDDFPPSTPYILMRSFPALLGVGTVLLSYLTLRNSGVRPVVAFITSAALIVENANITISRYILLDSPLLFFIAAAVYAWKKFEIQIPFSLSWYRSLIACGIALGLAVSSKWVGLFTVAWVGISCLYQLWFIIGDLSVSSKKVVHHFLARGIILLGIPALLYVLFFVVHFKLLGNEGDGSPFMSSAFRATLNGNSIPKDITANVGLGSIVTIRHLETQGGYLHSHSHFYPAGSKQQQITLYPHLDSNNNWLIEPFNDTISDEFVPLANDMKIRLKHVNTGRRLHSHDEKAPVSERDWQKEASCYGFENFEGDANDDFVVEIVDYKSAPGEPQHSVKALQTVFRLKHAMTGHYLFSSEVKLPEWGFGQQEVTTASQGYRPLTHWYIETNHNERVNDNIKEIINYPVLSLWDKIWESHKRMWKINQGLTEHHNWQSSPTEWPLLLRGINYWVKDHRQIYFIGNSLIWWSTSLAVLTFIVHAVFSLIRWQNGSRIAVDKNVFNFNSQVFLYVLGWLMHYFPFFIMGRQLFLHHYIPAAYFGLLALGHFFELFVGYVTASSKVLQRMAYTLLGLFLTFSLLFYVHYSSLIYGNPWTRQQCEASKVLNSWDFDCGTFLTDINQYASLASSPTPTTSYILEATPIENQADLKEATETLYVNSQNVAKEDTHQSAIEQANVEDNRIEEKNEQAIPSLAVDLEETRQAN